MSTSVHGHGVEAGVAAKAESGRRGAAGHPLHLHPGELTDPELIGNRNFWSRYDWTNRGEELSEAWGGSDGLWFGMLYPRLRRLLPTGTILEIGCGAGRVTHYLRQWADRTIAVDLAERPVRICRERFGVGGADVECIVNDGRSLSMIDDGSVDVCVSIDALVFSEIATVRGYLEQLKTKLVPGGVALLHTSNLGQYGGAMPDDPTGQLLRGRRAAVSAAGVREACDAIGLACVSQELFSCSDSATLTDALSFIRRDRAGGGGATKIEERWDWSVLQCEARRVSALYRTVPVSA